MLTLRTLTFSLLITIVVASIGAGLLLDKLYAGFQPNEKTGEGLTESQLQAIGTQLSGVLRRLENKQDFIQSWQTENDFLALELISREDVGMPEELFRVLESTGYITLTSATTISYYFPNEDNNYFVLRAPLASQYKPDNWSPILFTTSFYILLMLIVLAWLLPLVRRLQTLRLSAKKLGEGDLGARITPSAVSYIKDIELEFNRMAQRIEELVSDISLLSSAISHELRAPLAKLQFGLDALREEDDAEKRLLYQDRLDKVIAEMTDLIETLLRYARLDKNIAQLPQSEVDLHSLCTHLATSGIQPNPGGYGSESAQPIINTSIDDNFYSVNGDAFYLSLLLENLLSNAIKYGSGKILIRLQRKEGKIQFSVEDNGPGIAEHFRQDIFKPFIRGEENNRVAVRSTSPKGHGLGMALVKRIADLHNAHIEIANSETLGGAKLSVIFREPLYK